MESTRFTCHNWTSRQRRHQIQQVMIDHDRWNCSFCEYHDNLRSISGYAADSDEYRFYGAKLLSLIKRPSVARSYPTRTKNVEWEVCPRNQMAKPSTTISRLFTSVKTYGTFRRQSHDQCYLAHWRSNLT